MYGGTVPALCSNVEEIAPVTNPTGQVLRQAQAEVQLVRIADLVLGYSPRHEKLDEDHVQALLEVIDRLPPIIVDERTMKVLDGMHRLEASRRAARTELPAVFFSGSETEALVVAIQANIKHGKPLSRGERQAAAAALLRRCPERSDRWGGEICGLSHSTVARVRQATDAMDNGMRTGRAGRRRPVDPAPTQATLARALESRSSSVRQVAKATGVTSSTAHRAAARLRSAKASPELSLAGAATTGAESAEGAGTGSVDIDLARVPDKPETAEWLARTAVASGDIDTYLINVPLSRVYEVVDECRRRAHTWSEMADFLEKRVRAGQEDQARAGAAKGP